MIKLQQNSERSGIAVPIILSMYKERSRIESKHILLRSKFHSVKDLLFPHEEVPF